MNEYRCTRRDPYRNPNCPGHADLRARQGYYIVAATEEAALRNMKEDFPDDLRGFDVQLVRENVTYG